MTTRKDGQDTFRLRIESADEIPRKISPEAWRPTVTYRPALTDNEWDSEPVGRWRRFYFGDEPCWLMFADDAVYTVEKRRRSFRVEGMHRHGHGYFCFETFRNGYDAFWFVEQQVGVASGTDGGGADTTGGAWVILRDKAPFYCIDYGGADEPGNAGAVPACMADEDEARREAVAQYDALLTTHNRRAEHCANAARASASAEPAAELPAYAVVGLERRSGWVEYDDNDPARSVGLIVPAHGALEYRASLTAGFPKTRLVCRAERHIVTDAWVEYCNPMTPWVRYGGPGIDDELLRRIAQDVFLGNAPAD